MDYEDSERSGYQQREGMNWAGDTHIRQEDRGVVMYAVFDGKEQISEEYAPPQDHLCLEFAAAYSRGLRNGSESYLTSYDEREDAEMSRITDETQELISILFEHIEYILGNADFEAVDIDFGKMESMRAALGEMSEYVSTTEFQNLGRR